jgi:hypothetical protein
VGHDLRLTYPFLKGDNAYFSRYGSGCGGSLGYASHLDATGSPNPFEISLHVSRGVPSGLGALFVSAVRVDEGCLLFGPPFFGPLLFSLDDRGEANLAAGVQGTSSGARFVLQLLSLEKTAPEVWNASNGVQITPP